MEVIEGHSLGQLTPSQNLTMRVNPSGVTLVIATPIRYLNDRLNNDIKEKWTNL